MSAGKPNGSGSGGGGNEMKSAGVSITPQKGRSLMTFAAPLIVVLSVIAVFVWLSRPKPEMYNPPPPPVKTVADIQKQIDDVTKNTKMPKGAKGMVLGMLQGEMAKAKQREQGVPPPSAPKP